MQADRQGRLSGFAMLSDAAVQEMAAWRQDLHRHPETAFDEHRTAGKIAGLLRSFGLEVATGIGRTGVVGTLRAGGGSRSIGLRADMDALHLHEQGELPYRSQHAGRMHACGHDGHCAMLLGAARHLAESRAFDGTVQFIFQPAEENEGGGQEMLEDGLFERFPVDGVYGMHNWPGLPLGQMAMHPGPMMMAFDLFEIRLRGQGGHAAMPERTRDVIAAQAQLVTALQSIVSRNVDPLDCAVLSVTQVEAGSTWNIIPEQALLRGTVRYVDPAVQAVIESRMRELVDHIALAMAWRRTWITGTATRPPSMQRRRPGWRPMSPRNCWARPMCAPRCVRRWRPRISPSCCASVPAAMPGWAWTDPRLAPACTARITISTIRRWR
ncbi:Uncharacterized hydrolase YxeP [Chromobacterium violaceum]|uniref:Uncharacterized hydrolase YxeP n=1 Tax=Chromobacterium violaceum TaxID=536 RepID=A0A3S4LH64_CHRVL|nr:Uncharacterized hydrolase YxeP [Chromobacterium violaceum]